MKNFRFSSDIESRLIKIISEIKQHASEIKSNEFIERLNDSQELAIHNEAKIALENLCENLCEYDFKVTRSELAEIEKLCKIVEIEFDACKHLLMQ